MRETLRKARGWWRAAVLGLAAGGLYCAPAAWTEASRGYLLDALKPGQSGAQATLEAGRTASEWTGNLFRNAAETTRLAAERDRLQAQNAALAGQLRAAQAQVLAAQGAAHDAQPGEPLLHAQLIEARVLGRLARQHLAAIELLDAGANSGIEPDALVVDPPATEHLDIGTDAAVTHGDLVLLGRRVLGRVEHVGQWTSAVRRVTSNGYRDLVRLAHVDGKTVHFAAQGVLEGNGSDLCRIRLIPVTEPVSVGDLVYTASSDGLVPAPLLYGRIVRAERQPADAHWQLWMKPAAANDPLDRVAVLRAETNPKRIADSPHPLPR